MLLFLGFRGLVRCALLLCIGGAYLNASGRGAPTVPGTDSTEEHNKPAENQGPAAAAAAAVGAQAGTADTREPNTPNGQKTWLIVPVTADGQFLFPRAYDPCFLPTYIKPMFRANAFHVH